MAETLPLSIPQFVNKSLKGRSFSHFPQNAARIKKTDTVTSCQMTIEAAFTTDVIGKWDSGKPKTTRANTGTDL